MKTPYFSKEQLDYLDSLYPERCPDPKWTDREIWIAVGQRKVVRTIKKIFEEQEEKALSTLRKP